MKIIQKKISINKYIIIIIYMFIYINRYNINFIDKICMSIENKKKITKIKISQIYIYTSNENKKYRNYVIILY